MPSGYWAAARHVHAAWQTRAAMSSGTASVSSTRLCRILKATACVKSCCMPASTSSPARASSNSGTTHTLPRPPTRQRTVHLVNLVSPGKKTFVCPRCHSVTTPRRAERSLELGDALHARIETAGRKEGKGGQSEKNARRARRTHATHSLFLLLLRSVLRAPARTAQPLSVGLRKLPLRSRSIYLAVPPTQSAVPPGGWHDLRCARGARRLRR